MQSVKNEINQRKGEKQRKISYEICEIKLTIMNVKQQKEVSQNNKNYREVQSPFNFFLLVSIIKDEEVLDGTKKD